MKSILILGIVGLCTFGACSVRNDLVESEPPITHVFHVSDHNKLVVFTENEEFIEIPLVKGQTDYEFATNGQEYKLQYYPTDEYNEDHQPGDVVVFNGIRICVVEDGGEDDVI